MKNNINHIIEYLIADVKENSFINLRVGYFYIKKGSISSYIQFSIYKTNNFIEGKHLTFNKNKSFLGGSEIEFVIADVEIVCDIFLKDCRTILKNNNIHQSSITDNESYIDINEKKEIIKRLLYDMLNNLNQYVYLDSEDLLLEELYSGRDLDVSLQIIEEIKANYIELRGLSNYFILKFKNDTNFSSHQFDGGAGINGGFSTFNDFYYLSFNDVKNIMIIVAKNLDMESNLTIEDKIVTFSSDDSYEYSKVLLYLMEEYDKKVQQEVDLD